MIIDALDRVLGTICLIYLRICQLLLVLLVGGILAEVVMRYGFGSAFLATGELARLAITWLVFLMAAVLHRTRRHIAVTALVDLFSGRVRRALDVIIHLCTILLSVFVLFQLLQVWDFLSLRTAVLRIPDTAFKVAVAFAFVPIAMQSIVGLFRPSLPAVQGETPVLR